VQRCPYDSEEPQYSVSFFRSVTSNRDKAATLRIAATAAPLRPFCLSWPSSAMRSLLLSLAWLGLASAVFATQQLPFVPYSSLATSRASAYNAYDDGLFTPFEDLKYLSDDQFTTFEHAFHPGYGVRLKKSHFCDETVK
jgi:hypothetical protein